MLQADLYNKLSQSKVIQEAALRSGIAKGAINAAWDAIGEVIKAWATEGHSVAVPGLGTMRFGLRSKSIADVNKVGSDLITTRRVIFTPNVEIKEVVKTNLALILTKTDKDVDEKLIADIKEVFSSVGTETYFVSNKTKEGLEEVKALFANEVSCVMGQTGVGKSSLINAIDPNYEREIGEYSFALGRGKHRTKEVILLPYQGGYIADTPGFSSLDLNLFKEDLAAFFPAFNHLYNKCYYTDCLHISEPKCAVKEAINEGKISPKAYECYQKLLDEAIFKKERYNR